MTRTFKLGLHLAVIMMCLPGAMCQTSQGGFPRPADVRAIVKSRPKIPPAALDPRNPTAAEEYRSDDRAWSQAVASAGGRICRALAAMGMKEIDCPLVTEKENH